MLSREKAHVTVCFLQAAGTKRAYVQCARLWALSRVVRPEDAQDLAFVGGDEDLVSLGA